MTCDQTVAVVFDFDRTLSPAYMQRPLFAHYGVDEAAFWAICHHRAAQNSLALGTRCFVEHEYLNQILLEARQGSLKGLTNKRLRELGKSIELYPGVDACFKALRAEGAEIYIVTSGIRTMLLGLPEVEQHVSQVIGAEFTDFVYDEDGEERYQASEVQTVACTLLPSDKTRVMQDISKGCSQRGFDPCVKVADEDRRTPFPYMIYVGDGLSDVYAFDVVRSNGGHTLGVYDPDAGLQRFKQLEMIREEGWLSTIAVADFRPEAAAGNWLINKTKALVEQLRDQRAEPFRIWCQDRRGKSPEYRLNGTVLA